MFNVWLKSSEKWKKELEGDGSGCGSVVQRLPSICKALGSISSSLSPPVNKKNE